MLLGMVSVALADAATQKAAEKAARQMLEDAFLYMGVAYLCQDAIGTSHYYAARIATEHAARLGGKSEADAVIIADDFDKRIKIDVPKKAPAGNLQKCMDKLLETQTAFRVSKARFEKAAAADRN
jgi:hypothetical protein